MAKQGVSSPDHLLALQVWGGLSPEHRARAVRLMVQLALKLVAAQLDWSQKEVKDVKRIGQTQSAS